MNGETTAPAGCPWFQRLLAVARACAVVSALAAAVGILVELRREAAWSTHELSPTPGAAVSAAAESPSAARLRRPRYRHSVIVGGAFSREEVEGVVQEDAVVAVHYRGLDLDGLRTTVVREPRDVYVSYRIGQRVYWTREPVRLAAGETLLTDGTNEIRARCGNRISDIPRTPVSDLEPVAEELDDAEDPQGESSMDGERALESTPGTMAHVPFLTLLQQPPPGNPSDGLDDAVFWPVSPTLLVFGTPAPDGQPTEWGDPAAVKDGTGRDGSPAFGYRPTAPLGAFTVGPGSGGTLAGGSGTGVSSGGGSTGGSSSGGGSGSGSGSGDSGSGGGSGGGGSEGGAGAGGSTGGFGAGGSSGGGSSGGPGSGGGSGSGSGGSGGSGSSGGSSTGGSEGGAGTGGSTGGSGSGGSSGGGSTAGSSSGGGSGSGSGGSGGGTGTGGGSGYGGGGGGWLPPIYPGSEGVIVTTGTAPAVPEPGLLSMLALGAAAAVIRWARKPQRRRTPRD